MIFKDYYKILGLETNKVNMDEIKSAYKKQAKIYHPDVNSESPNAEERFKDINEAYKILSDVSAKRKYDRSWNVHIGRNKVQPDNKKGSTINNIFDIFVGGNATDNVSNRNTKSKEPMRGENIETEINVSIEEAYYGLDKKISLRAVDGRMKTFSIKIPAGIRDSEKIRLLGQGKNGVYGGKNGDLFIKVNIEDGKVYRLSGCDIHTDLLLTPWEAALGTRVPVESIDESVSVFVPEGIESGERVRIPGKGYKDGKGGRGDLVAEVKIVVPKKLTEEEREIFEKLNEVSKFEPRGRIINI